MTTNGRHDRTIPALGRYWDELVLGQPVDARDVDPALAEMVRLLHARDDAPAPDPVFKARLRDRLELQRVATHDAEHLALPLGHGPSHGAREQGTIGASVRVDVVPLSRLDGSGRAPAARAGGDRYDLLLQPTPCPITLPPIPTLPGDPAPAPRPGSLWRGRFAANLATAALLAFLLLAGSVAFGGVRLRWERQIEQALGIPAVEFPPDPATQQGLLTWMPVTGLPRDAGYVAIERWTYPPHAEPVTTPPLSGPMLMFVTAGQVTVSLEGRGAQVRGMAQAQPTSLLALPTGQLAAGEAMLLPANSRMTTWNAAAAVAKALVVPILRSTEDDWTLPYNQTTVAQELLASARGEFPMGPQRIELRRSTLAPGERMPPPRAGTFRLVGAESKYLAYLGRATDGAVTNLEKEPVDVLIVTVVEERPS